MKTSSVAFGCDQRETDDKYWTGHCVLTTSEKTVSHNQVNHVKSVSKKIHYLRRLAPLVLFAASRSWFGTITVRAMRRSSRGLFSISAGKE